MDFYNPRRPLRKMVRDGQINKPLQDRWTRFHEGKDPIEEYDEQESRSTICGMFGALFAVFAIFVIRQDSALGWSICLALFAAAVLLFFVASKKCTLAEEFAEDLRIIYTIISYDVLDDLSETPQALTLEEVRKAVSTGLKQLTFLASETASPQGQLAKELLAKKGPVLASFGLSDLGLTTPQPVA